MAEGSPFGQRPEDDYPVLEPPADEPGFGENHAFWLVFDDGSGYVNAHLNSIDSFWPLRREAITVCLPDGDALVEMNEGWGTSRDTIASGGMRARCIEPMRRWRLAYKGTMRETTQEHLARALLPDGEGNRVIVDWEADVICDPPPFRQGATNAAWQALQQSSGLGYLGGARYEQLCRATGRLRVHGGREFDFAATGIRTHRAGVRRMTQMLRSDWQTALFPDGSGFGLMRLRGEDGSVEWEEARILRDGQLHPAQILTDNWVTRREIAGDRMSIRLESDLGLAQIEGEIACSIFRGISMTPAGPGVKSRGPLDRTFGFETAGGRTLVLQQSGARYTMSGMTTHGVCERHNFADEFDTA